MTANLDTLSTTDNSVTDKSVPSYLDQTPITWDSNDASIDGALFQFGKWSQRTGSFATLFKHHASTRWPRTARST